MQSWNVLGGENILAAPHNFSGPSGSSDVVFLHEDRAGFALRFFFVMVSGFKR